MPPISRRAFGLAVGTAAAAGALSPTAASAQSARKPPSADGLCDLSAIDLAALIRRTDASAREVMVALCVLLLTVPAAAQTVTASDAPVSGAIPPASLGRIVRDSLKLLVVEHGVRVAFQPKTRGQLEGPFWRDYRRSVRVPRHWEDSDDWPVNYVGHPIHGAAAGFLWTIHDPAARTARIGLDGAYWGTRWRPLVWSAIYSVQFEVGPFSEASVGNVGLRPETIGWVDYVVTPVGALGLMVAEDALDRFFLEWFERHVRNRPARAILRTIFNPSRAMANVAANRLPWHRETRSLRTRRT